MRADVVIVTLKHTCLRMYFDVIFVIGAVLLLISEGETVGRSFSVTLLFALVIDGLYPVKVI